MNICKALICIAFLVSGAGTSSAQSVDNNDNKSHLIGQNIYRQGILPSGKPSKAFVMDDIPVSSTTFTCESCHRRSGLGSIEANIIVPPVNGRMLYKPQKSWDTWTRHSNKDKPSPESRDVPSFFLGQDQRPSYTDESLAHLIEMGTTPSGRKLNSVMPTYDFSNNDMYQLIRYLKYISSDYSPGVTDSKIHFATVITDDVSPIDRDAMLSVLETVIKDRNAQTRNQAKRASKGAFIKREMDVGYRLASLDVWELKGSKETWPDQLEKYYKKKPVFALLGGISEDTWSPIHEFSEKNNVPCIFPITDQPVVSSSNWNTLYFSKGLYQEGESTARYLRRRIVNSKKVRILQIFIENSDGALVAHGFEETWNKFKISPVENISLQTKDLNSEEFWIKLIEPEGNEVILFWMDKGDLPSINTLSGMKQKPLMIFLSSGLIGNYISSIPYRLRNITYITYPYSLPGAKEKNLSVVKTWLKIKKIPVSNLNIQAKMYFLAWMLPEALMEMNSEFYRDYFLESFDMMDDQTHSIAVYPRLSFGPYQRYLSKGCYIVQLSKGPDVRLIKKGNWIIH